MLIKLKPAYSKFPITIWISQKISLENTILFGLDENQVIL